MIRFIIIIFSLVTCNLPGIGYADDWDEVREAAKNIKSVSAEFAQEKHMKILVKPLLSKGKFYFNSPDSLRWEYISPLRSILMMHRGRVKSYAEGADGLVEDSRAKAQAMNIVMQEITSWLNGQFTDNPNFRADLKKGPEYKIVLTPKEKAVSNIIKSIEITILKDKGIIKSVSIRESEDSFTLLQFYNIRQNSPIDDAVFQKI